MPFRLSGFGGCVHFFGGRPALGAPLGTDEPLVLQPVEDGVQRPLLQLQVSPRLLADAAQQLVAVGLPAAQKPQYQHLQHTLFQLAVKSAFHNALPFYWLKQCI